ncbi:hypothetical protein CsatB_016804 [Cannabis sativa]
MNSVELVNEVFQDFIRATGLVANKKKSHIYFGGVKEEIKNAILEITQMEEGSFSLNYLGVKLRPTKWRAEDCCVILDKLSLKLNGWASRNLSFAGCAQLIHSVLLGIRNFWMSLFILPQKIVVAVDKKCRDFLWGVNGNRSKLHMPSWEKVCLPKQFGGIGFREGKKWNMAMVAKHLWAISSKQDNLWVKLINSIYLKNQDVWSCPIKPDLSWYFKKLLKIRNVTNANMVNQAVKGNKFKVNRFYNELIEADRTPYTATVWHKYIVPKHRFMFWQIINENLLTRDHLSRFFPIHSGLCLVCDDAPESHNHLFFECIFTRNLIVFVEKWAGHMHWPKNISELHDRVLPAKANLASKIMNAITAAALYLLWKNRNDCLFSMVCNSVASLSKEIKSVVKARVLGLYCTSQRKKDQYVLRLLNSW